MDITAISGLIGSVGFPIAMCMYLAYNSNKQQENHRETENKLADIISNNTLAITKLSDKIDAIEKQTMNDKKSTND